MINESPSPYSNSSRRVNCALLSYTSSKRVSKFLGSYREFGFWWRRFLCVYYSRSDFAGGTHDLLCLSQRSDVVYVDSYVSTHSLS